MSRKLKTGTIILIVVCFIGLCVLLYPSVANYWNENIATHAVTEYVSKVAEISEEEYQKYWEEAIAFNKNLQEASSKFDYVQEHMEEYKSCLNMDGSGIMGFIDIPKIDESLPLYHTTDASVLAIAVGHLEWTSLPTGGEGTHCCVSGHRGLASMKLFTDLDQLREGDQFTMTVLNEVLTYEVDQIRTVLPNEVADLAIDPLQDYCTLITCTPYGINTHRLLVRGRRVATVGPQLQVVSEAVVVDMVIVASCLAFPILFTLLIIVLFKKPKKKVTLSDISSIQSDEADPEGDNR